MRYTHRMKRKLGRKPIYKTCPTCKIRKLIEGNFSIRREYRSTLGLFRFYTYQTCKFCKNEKMKAFHKNNPIESALRHKRSEARSKQRRMYTEFKRRQRREVFLRLYADGVVDFDGKCLIKLQPYSI